MLEIMPLTDIDRLVEWRREVVGEVFGAVPSAELLSANRRYYERHIPDGSHLERMAPTPVAGRSVCRMSCRRPIILLDAAPI